MRKLWASERMSRGNTGAIVRQSAMVRRGLWMLERCNTRRANAESTVKVGLRPTLILGDHMCERTMLANASAERVEHE